MALNIKKGNEMMQIPVIPLVDTVFNLLIFFLVATKIAEADRELDVVLPDAAHAMPLISKPREVVVNIDARGHFFVAAQPVTLGQLDQILKAARTNTARANPAARASVVIRADKRCRSEFLVTAMDACTRAKIRDFRVMTRDPRQGEG
jgi:biopolymer transport protein ExbD